MKYKAFLLLIMSVFAFGFANAAEGDIRDQFENSWSYYKKIVRNGASIQERVQVLDRIEQKYRHAGLDLSLVKIEKGKLSAARTTKSEIEEEFSFDWADYNETFGQSQDKQKALEHLDRLEGRYFDYPEGLKLIQKEQERVVKNQSPMRERTPDVWQDTEPARRSSASSSERRSAPRMSGNFNLFLGAKALNKEDWEPIESHGEAGFQFDFGMTDWPVHLSMDWLVSASNTERIIIADPSFGIIPVDLEAATTELNLGLKKIWTVSNARPFLSGGLSFMSAEATLAVAGLAVTDSGSGTGAWLGGGIFFTVGSFLNLGIEGKFSSASVTLFDEEFNSGGGHFGLIGGIHF